MQDLDFDRKQLKIVQGKGKKDRYVPLSEHLIRGLKKYIEAEKPQEYLFNGQPLTNGAGGDFDNRYSQRGVQWAVRQVAKAAGVKKEVHTHTLRHSYATHLLEDGMDIMTLKDLLGTKTSKTPSQTYFKHCVYGLRFLLKSEGLPYEYLRLPSIKHEKKLPVVLSKEEVWAMLQGAKLLKHKILIGLLYAVVS